MVRKSRKAKKASGRNCPKGKTYKKGYTRKAFTRSSGIRVKGSKVKGGCVKSKGLKATTGHAGQKVIKNLRKGELKKFGYANVKSMAPAKRHAALKKAIAKYGAHSVEKKLVAVSTLTRNTSTQSSKTFKDDVKWIRKSYASEFGRKKY